MDIKVKYRPLSGPDAKIESLELELPDGSVKTLVHGGDILNLAGDGRYVGLLTYVRFRDGSKPSFADLSHSKVLGVTLGRRSDSIGDFEAYAVDASRNIFVPLARMFG